MSKIVPFKQEVETLLCGNCQDDEGFFFIGTDFIAFCPVCTWTVKLKSSPYPDWKKDNE